MTRPLARPRAVLFDLFHTLVSVPTPGGEFGPTTAASFGIPGAQDELQRRYHDDDVLGRCLGRIRDPHEILRTLAHGLDASISEEHIATALAWRRRRFEHGLVAVEPAILAALDRLREVGVSTALVSDAGYDDVEAWPRSPLRHRFDAVVFSYEIGIRKPDRRIYERALESIGVEAGDALFVGDGGSDEHRGARAVGLGTVLVTRMLPATLTDGVAARRLHADWEFSDVPALVAALDL
jgi:putative hydrolase of the HAD superfamily